MLFKHILKYPTTKVEVLGDKIVEKQVKKFCDLYFGKEEQIKNPQKVLEQAKNIVTRYTLQINMVESTLSGTTTKYRIRQGMVFNITKPLVKAINGPKWIEWFNDNFDAREFRTVQDYMKLAKVKNIIRYAVFGKERLLQIERQLTNENKETDDPVGSFIDRNGIQFDPAEEVDVQELKIETDIAINHQRLLKEGFEIPKAMVDALVREGKEVESVHLRELTFAKEAGLDNQQIVARFEQMIAAGGKFEPLMTPKRKAEGFKKTTHQFIKGMDSAIEDEDYRGELNVEIIAILKTKLEQLERLIFATK